MAGKLSKDLIKDAKSEHQENFGKSKNITDVDDLNETQKDPAPGPARGENIGSQEKITNAKDSDKGPFFSQAENIKQPIDNSFRDKYDEYFKGTENLIAGSVIVDFVDNLKADFLFVHAQKNGVNLEKKAFLMEEKSKKFAAFLVDHGIKNNLFSFVEKYPLPSAVGVIALSGVSSYLMIEMFKKGNKEKEAMQKKTAELEAELEKYRKAESDKVKTNVDNAIEQIG